MKRILVGIMLVAASCLAQSQTTYDSKTLVDTNNNSTSTSTVTSTNTNNNNNVNINTTTVNSTNVNTNVNESNSKSTSTNTNYNYGHTTSDNKNTNVNQNTSTSTSVNTNNNNNTSTSTNTNVNQNVNSGDMTNRNINDSNITQKVIQPPPTAIAPAMMSGGNTDLCTTGTSGSVQTQIMGVSTGGTIRDMNCERLKLSKTLYDMGMKVAAVATMCQDRRVFDAMMQAGTPCPYEGQIGVVAKMAWEANPDKIPKLEKETKDDTVKKIGLGALLGAIIFKLF